MELFTITCTTCHARLKVRDAAAIGQILACPKCESMVQVVPPTGWQPQSAQPAQAAQPAVEKPGLGSSITLPLPPRREKPRASAASSAAAATVATATAAIDAASEATPVPASAEAVANNAASASSAAAGAAGATPTSTAHAIVQWCKLHWLVASVVPVATMALTAGTWMLVGGSDDSPAPTTAASEPAQSEAIPAEEAIAAAPPSRKQPSPFDRWLPANAVSVVRIPVRDLRQQPTVETLLCQVLALQGDAGVYQTVVDPICSALHVTPENVRRLTWAATAGLETIAGVGATQGVAIVDLAEPAAPQTLFAAARALDLKLGEGMCHQLPAGAWAHPVALVDERTIVTGPIELLRELSVRDQGSSERHEDATPKGQTNLSSAALARAIGLCGPDAPDSGTQAIMAVDLTAVRGRSASSALALLDHWPQARDDWQTVRDLPVALLVRAALRDAVEFEVALVCEEPTSAEKVRESLDRFAAAAASAIHAERDALSKRLVASAIDSATADQLDLLLSLSAAALDARQLQIDDATVWLRARVASDPPALAAVATASAAAIEGRRLEVARTLDEANHQRLLAGLAGYERAEHGFPLGAGGAALLPPENRLSWLATMLPYYDHVDWHRELNFGRPWNDAANRSITRRPLELVVNPALAVTTHESGFPVTHYVGVAGIGADAGQLEAGDPRAGVFGFGRRVGQKGIGDGASNTVALLGVSGRLGPWAAGGEATVRPLTKAPYVNGPDGFGSGQPDGMLAGMADGSVRFLSKDIDPRVVEQLATINGGERTTIELPKAGPPDRLAADGRTLDPVPSSRAPGAAVVPMPSAEPAAPAVALKAAAASVAPPGVDVEARLREKLPAIRSGQITLAELVDLLGQLAGLDITLDPQALAEAQIKPDELVSVELKDTTIGQALQTALAEYDLGYVVDGGHVVVTSRQRQMAVLVKATHEVADLAGESPDASAKLAVLVQRLVEPASWKAAGGRGTCATSAGQLHVEQSPPVQRQVFVLLEKLRVARGRPSRSSRDDESLALDTRYGRARERLEAAVSANFSRPTPLVEVLAYLRRVSGTQLLVDGPALAALGLSRQSPVTLVVQNQPLKKALNAMLDPLKLTVRIIDGQALQITSRGALRDRLELEFYPAADLLGKASAADSLIERVKSQLAAATWNDAGGPGVIEFDAASGCLLVLQTQEVQVTLEELLESWRSAN